MIINLMKKIFLVKFKQIYQIILKINRPYRNLQMNNMFSKYNRNKINQIIFKMSNETKKLLIIRMIKSTMMPNKII